MIATSLLIKMGIAGLFAGLIAVATTPFVKALALRFGVIREVRGRDSHDHPIPLWGGLAMVAGFLITVLLLRPLAGQELTVAVGRGEHPILGILLGASLVAAVGLLDDKGDLKPWQQMLSLLVGGLIAALLGARIGGVTNPFAGTGSGYTAQNYIELPFALSVLVTMVWIFLVAKTFDFLDGLDGLAAGVCAIAATTMGLMAAARGDVAVALMAAALAGACVGFLRHNYNPASIFMGTVGAQFLGFVLASLAVVGAFKIPAAISIVIPLLVLGVPVFDGLYVVGRRMVLRQKATVADRTHIHHRLRDRGMSVKQAVWAIYGLTATCCVAALALAWMWAR
ncbi:MAG: undecaprenyl/decaprenyl-phosphate alpha-N-acetylglucosaminyl 1-phosphate transferase [Cytophagales bacterium]|nr:undecaprenyl/decaprenyl-phosphate alpha-N-acetylglucosaminyl 1-phosphate transferase [Armatimonadota bacterium]